MKRKAVSWFIFLWVGLSGFSNVVNAQTAVAPSGEGTKAAPYLIQTLENLQWVSENKSSWSSHFRQTGDIDASETKNWNSGAGFDPIGDLDTAFDGSYDGDGHVITGLTIIRQEEDYVGLFGTAFNAAVENLGLVDLRVHGKDWVGGIIGAGKRDTLRQVFVTGSVSGNNQVGGMIGWNDNYFIEEAWIRAEVTGNNKVGGFIGYGNYGIARYAYTESSVVGVEEVGGFMGDFAGIVEQCYAAGLVTGTHEVGPVYGIKSASSQINSCYSDKSAVGSSYLNQHGPDPVTGGEATMKSRYSGWDFENMWFIIDRKTRPFLRFEWSERIHTLHQLQLMSMNISASYTLSGDLSGSGISEDPSHIWVSENNFSFIHDNFGFVPIGDADDPFSGSFDGNGFTISELWMDRADEDGVGLFGHTNGATLTNLRLEQLDITGGDQVGGVIGHATSTILQESVITGEVAGGTNVGGMIGEGDASISQSYGHISVSGETKVGGIAGLLTGTISDSYILGSVTGTTTVGGMTGDNQGTITSSYSLSRIEENEGATETGGLTGKTASAAENSYWNIETSGINSSATGTGLTSSQMRDADNFNAWDFTDIWDIQQGGSYPFLRENTQSSLPGTSPFIFGSGTPEDPYQIENSNQLNEIRNYLSSHFKLTKDIDMSVETGSAEGAFWNSGLGWDPIGSEELPFDGSLDGNGHFITRLTMNRTLENRNGFFGWIGEEGEITRLGLQDVNLSSNTTLGGISAVNHGSITESSVTGILSAQDTTGGITALNYGTVTDCYSAISIQTEESAGGIAVINHGEVDRCYSSEIKNLETQQYGLVDTNEGTFTNSYFSVNENDPNFSDAGNSLNRLQMHLMDSYQGWDFVNTWSIDEYRSAPYLKNSVPDLLPGTIEFEGGTGTSNDPYLIAHHYQLHSIRYMLNDFNTHYKLINDIDLGDQTGTDMGIYWNDGTGWDPIGDYKNENRFSGSLDGNGHTISDLYLNRPEQFFTGLFGTINNATIKNLHLKNVWIRGGSDSGGIVGVAYNWLVIENVSVTGEVASVSGEAGGIAGDKTFGRIKNSFTNVKITGDTYLNGFLGSQPDEISYSMSKLAGEEEVLVIGASGDDTYTLEGDELFAQANYPDFDFESQWDIYDGSSPPFLKNGAEPFATNVTIQGTEGWRLMSIPVEGMNIGTALETLWTQGFPNSDAPESGIQNVAVWGEHFQSWVPVPAASFIPPAGVGFIAYVYDDQDYDGTPEGFPKRLTHYSTSRTDSVSIPLTYTDGELSEEQKGWNLVGNPFGFGLDWDTPEGWDRSNIDASIYLWNSEAGEYQSWNGEAGTLQNGLISPWQGFWVKANAAEPILEANQSARSDSILQYKNKPVPHVKFILSNEKFSSSSIVMFNEKALLEKDLLDTWKLQPLSDEYLSVFTQLEDGTGLDVNALPLQFDNVIEIPINFEGSDLNGLFKLAWNIENLPEGIEVALHENSTGEVINISESSVHEFTLKNKRKRVNKKEPFIAEHGVTSPEIIKIKESGESNLEFILTIGLKDSDLSVHRVELPESIALDQNYPNPFNPSTTIKYQLPENSLVDLRVFDMLGREVATLIDSRMEAGYHQTTFNARHLASGMYLYRLKTGSTVITKKLILIK